MKNLRPLLLLTTLFFAWGFLTSINDILIPYLRGIFELSYVQAMLVQFAFFGAYFIGSLLYFVLSITRGDPIARIGYQKGIVGGLILAGIGALLFYPAAHFLSYPFFLGALFTVGLGFTLLQISANPYVAILGDPQGASSRLNLCQGLNSIGTVLGPLIGGYLLLGITTHSEELGASSVQMPYLVFGGCLFLLALFFSFVDLPALHKTESMEKNVTALKFPQLSLGILAIFFYVGAEVSIGSLLINFFKLPEIGGKLGGIEEAEGSTYVAMYWGGLMIGRLLGSVSLSNLAQSKKTIALVVIPALGYLFLVTARCLIADLPLGKTLADMSTFLPFLVLNAIAFRMGRNSAGFTTTLFAILAAVLLAVGVASDGSLAMWCIIAVGLFNSVLWSNIFTLAIRGLGPYTSQGSSLLVMAIVGGALFPLLQGKAADLHGVHLSYLVPIIAYVYIAWYGSRQEPLMATQIIVTEENQEEIEEAFV